MDNILKALLCILLLSFSCSCSDDGIKDKVEVEQEEPEDGSGIIRNITASQLVADMGSGWNLGNSFDVTNSDKTYWGNPLPSTRLIDEVFKRGFKTLRLPVTWGYNMGDAPNFEIEESYFSSITNIIDHALAKDMYVIINVHHDEDWIVPTLSQATTTKIQLNKVWTQIANQYKNYSDYLIFELLNEPRHLDTPEEWSGGTPEGRNVLNDYYKTILNAIRVTGGNNAKRKVMIAPYGASVAQVAWDDFVIPNNDPDVIISIHAYSPYRFALEGTDPDWGTDEDKANTDALLNSVETNFIAKGRPVIMGEWGSVNTLADASERLKHATYFSKGCLKKGIVPIVWDNGREFGLIDRRTFIWTYPNIANAAANN